MLMRDGSTGTGGKLAEGAGAKADNEDTA